jgi:hypothetical protein
MDAGTMNWLLGIILASLSSATVFCALHAQYLATRDLANERKKADFLRKVDSEAELSWQLSELDRLVSN